MDMMRKMLDNKKVSPKTFQSKQNELEKWVTREKENLRKTRKDIEKGWTRFAETIKQTKRDIQFMDKMRRIEQKL